MSFNVWCWKRRSSRRWPPGCSSSHRCGHPSFWQMILGESEITFTSETIKMNCQNWASGRVGCSVPEQACLMSNLYYSHYLVRTYNDEEAGWLACCARSRKKLRWWPGKGSMDWEQVLARDSKKWLASVTSRCDSVRTSTEKCELWRRSDFWP